MRLSGEPVVTPGHGVANKIVKINRREGWVELKSERAQSGKKRRITVKMLENTDATTHGVIIRTLRALAERVPPSAGHWVGPFRIRDLLERCLDEDQAWPPEHGGVYLDSQHKWSGAPRRSGGCPPRLNGGPGRAGGTAPQGAGVGRVPARSRRGGA